MLPSDASAAMAAEAGIGLMVDRRRPSASRALPAELKIVSRFELGRNGSGVSGWLVRASDGGPLPERVVSKGFGTQVRLMDKFYLPSTPGPHLIGMMFDLLADIYDELATLEVNVSTSRALLQSVLEDAQPDPLVLDFGCGTGLAMVALATLERKVRLLGVDLSTAMLERAAARGEPVIPIEAWRRSPPAIDAAIASFVLHYGVPEEDLGRIAGALSPGGKFAANLFRMNDTSIEVLVRKFSDIRMDLLASSELGGTTARNAMLVFEKRG